MILLSYSIVHRELVGDAKTYLSVFNSEELLNYAIIEGKWGSGFLYLTKFFQILGSEYIYLMLFPCVLISSSIFMLKKIDEQINVITLFFLLTVSTVFVLYSITGFRQTIAISLGIVSLGYLFTKSYVKYILFIIVGATFHSTLIIYLLALIPILKELKYRYCALLYCISLVIGYLDLSSHSGFISEIVSSTLNSQRYEGYFSDYEGDYVVGLKVQFIAFSLLPIILLVFNSIFYGLKLNETENRLVCFYILINSACNVFSFIPFSDRIYAYSWFIIPLIMTLCYYRLSRSTRFFYFSILIANFYYYNFEYFI
ncbi:EpsG family protein [Vibrio breoganii]